MVPTLKFDRSDTRSARALAWAVESSALNANKNTACVLQLFVHVAAVGGRCRPCAQRQWRWATRQLRHVARCLVLDCTGVATDFGVPASNIDSLGPQMMDGHSISYHHQTRPLTLRLQAHLQKALHCHSAVIEQASSKRNTSTLCRSHHSPSSMPPTRQGRQVCLRKLPHSICCGSVKALIYISQ